jgi:hypothetical protein
MEYKGQLMAFVVDFSYQKIGVNNLFSDDLTNRFRTFDTISDRQLIDLFNSLYNTGNLNMMEGFDVHTVVLRNLAAYIDFENKTCDFLSDDFIDLIYDARNVTYDPSVERLGLGIKSRLSHDRTIQREHAARFLFTESGTQIYTYPLFFPYVEEVFADFIPMANDQGKLLIRAISSYLINEASENKELAFEFLRFMTTPEAMEDSIVITVPVHRGVLRSNNMIHLLSDSVERVRETDGLIGETEEIVEQLIVMLERCNEMPMQGNTLTGSGDLMEMLEDTLTNFHNGILTAQQAASELQNKVSLFLME